MFLIEFMRWSIAAALILPQSILLGTTFPLIGTAIVRMDQQHAGSTLGMLYFTNSIGAAIGVLVSVFYLIGLMGLPGAIFTAGLINIFIAFVIWSYCRRGSILATTEAISPATTPSSIQFDARWLAGIALLTGLASFFYEIAWIRMLSLVLGSSMQAFELMLSAFITGLAFGGLWIRNRIEKIDNPILFLGRVQIIMGLCAVATLPLYNQMFDFMSFLMDSLSKNESGYLLFNLGSHFIALLIMLPATFMAGMTLPLITFTLLKMNQGEASIGRVYAFNTIGAIIGIILAVHIAMPLIGTKGLIICGGLVDLGLGIFLITRFVDKTRSSSRLALEYALPVAFLLVVSFGTQFDTIALSSGVFRYGGTTFSGPAEVLYYQNGKTASISVVEIADGTLSLATNGKADAAIYPSDEDYGSDEATMTMLAALPLAIHPGAQTVANIGLGSGLTTHTLLLSPQLARIDTIEIEPALTEAIKHFGAHTENVLNDPRSRIVHDDAKSFFSRNNARYDIIVSEPSNPWVAGIASLFSMEFYRHISRHLNDDGIFVQWLHLYESNLNLVTSAFNALDLSFDDYAVYNANDEDIIIVASNGRDPSRLSDTLFTNNALTQQLNRVHLLATVDLSARFIGNKPMLQPYFDASQIPANSDYFPTLGLYGTRSRFLQENARELTELHTADFPPAMLTNPIVNNPATGLYFMGDRAKRTARNIVAMLSASEVLPYPVYSGDENYFMDLREKVNIVSTLLDSCQALTNKQQLFGNSLHAIAVNTLSFVDSEEMQLFWRQLGSHACLEAWPVGIQKWMKLYLAIGLKQHQQTITLATDLASSNVMSLPSQINFLTGATLTAYIKQGRTELARQFAYEIIDNSTEEAPFPLYIRLLFAQLGIIDR
ncbi:MAG: hypothetical protein QGG02_15185 [Gammaproteobacteria bacterium]|nr:hypothetical protein [Gammaproteobacteria bacterium]MDP6732931.1 hypothetical protein [Gammaproteobacteria bacterium]